MKKILVIEDDSRVGRALTARLTAAGYSTCVAADAQSAFLLARHEVFDLFLVDIHLPDGDGLVLAEKFLTMPQARLTPVLFLTASTEFQHRLRASRLGASGWLDKPYDPEDLLAGVRLALGESKPKSSEKGRFSPLKPCATKSN